MIALLVRALSCLIEDQEGLMLEWTTVRFKTCGWTIRWIEVKWFTVITIIVRCVVCLKASMKSLCRQKRKCKCLEYRSVLLHLGMLNPNGCFHLDCCKLPNTVEQRNIPRAIPKHIFITVIEWGRVSKSYLATSLPTSAHPIV